MCNLAQQEGGMSHGQVGGQEAGGWRKPCGIGQEGGKPWGVAQVERGQEGSRQLWEGSGWVVRGVKGWVGGWEASGRGGWAM